MTKLQSALLGEAKYRWVRRYLAKFHPTVMQEIYNTGIEGRNKEELNLESLEFLPKGVK